MKQNHFMIGICAWFAGSLYYLYQYILRVSPMVMVDSIRLDFLLDASAFGTLMAVGTYCYSSMQIPVGIISDLFGARKMILYSLLGCILGVGIFSTTEHLLLAYLGRMLVGLGSAAGFVCASKISSDWFPPHQKSLWFAATVSMGTAGAFLGGPPLAQMVGTRGWRESLFILVGIGVGVLILNFFLLRSKLHSKTGTLDKQAIRKQIQEVFVNRHCWMYALTALGMYLSISVFSDLWGATFLKEKFGIDRVAAAGSIAMSYFGVCSGVIIVALIKQFIKDSRLIIGFSAFCVVALMSLLMFIDQINLLALSCLMFATGFFAGAEVLCFSEACEHMPTSVAATVTGFINFIVTLGAAVMQQLFGYVLDWFWSGQMDANANKIYALSDYEKGFTMIILLACFPVILSFFLPKGVKLETK